MNFIKNIILVLVIVCMHHQDIICKGLPSKPSKATSKNEQLIPATLKDALEAINKKLKSKNM